MDPFRKVVKLAGEAVCDYGMIHEGDRILVGLSGGKDSFVLMAALTELHKRAPIDFEIMAATFDPGFAEMKVNAVAAECAARNWKHHLVSLNVAEMLQKGDPDKTPCVLCSRLRRGKLYGLAGELHCNLLALGHHFDDAATSFLMNLTGGRGLATMAPVMHSETAENVTVIRPLIYAEEAWIAEAAAFLGWQNGGDCPYQKELAISGERAFFRAEVERWKQRFPDLRQRVLTSLSSIREKCLLDRRFLP